MAYTVAEAAVMLGMSTDTLYDAIEAGLLPCRRPSERRIVLTTTDMNTYLERIADTGTWGQKTG